MVDTALCTSLTVFGASRNPKGKRRCIDLEALNQCSPFINAVAPADRGQEDRNPRYVGTKIPDICDRELNAIFTIT